MQQVLSGPNPTVGEITARLAAEFPGATSLPEIATFHAAKRFYEMMVALESAQTELSPRASAELLVAVCAPMIQRLRPFAVALQVDAAAQAQPDPEDGILLAEFFASAIAGAKNPTSGNAELRAYQESLQLLRITVGTLAVRKGALAEAEQIILVEVGKQVAGSAGVAPQLSAKLHRAAYLLFKASRSPGVPVSKKPHEQYNALTLFLAYQRLENLPRREIEETARDLLISGFISPRMFDYAELQNHPVVAGLADQDRWLKELVDAAAASDVATFRRVAARNDAQALETFGREGLQTLEVKLRVSLLLDLCFRKTAVSAQEIMQMCSLDTPEAAARLFMRALGADVLKGRIDGTLGRFLVDWVMPRAVDEQRLAEMAEGLRCWQDKIQRVAQ